MSKSKAALSKSEALLGKIEQIARYEEAHAKHFRLANNSSQIKLERLYSDIELINKKAENLKARGYIQEANQAGELAKSLKERTTEFFANAPEQQKEFFPSFIKECKEQLGKADELWAKNHRGYGQLFADILQSLTVIGILIGAIQWSLNGRYSLFSVKTESTQVIKTVKQDFEQIENSFKI